MDRGDPETLGHTNGFLGMVRLVNHHKPTKTSGLVDFQGMFFVRHATWVTFETKNKKMTLFRKISETGQHCFFGLF